MTIRSLSLAQEEAGAGGVMEATGLRYDNSSEVPEDSKGGKLGMGGVVPTLLLSPTQPSLYVRIRSPSPTWDWLLGLFSRSWSTDCSNARAATRLKNAVTFSPGDHKALSDAVALSEHS